MKIDEIEQKIYEIRQREEVLSKAKRTMEAIEARGRNSGDEDELIINFGSAFEGSAYVPQQYVPALMMMIQGYLAMEAQSINKLRTEIEGQ
jgi:hypothetical protein